jgi:hypothetical protein
LRNPAGWLSREVTEAFPWDTAPRYLLRDRDASYGVVVRRREPTWACSVAAEPYSDVPSGSIPLFLMASEARPEARNSISRLEASISPEPARVIASSRLMI